MNIYTGLLFQHGFIQEPQLALSLGRDQPRAVPQIAQAAPRFSVSAAASTVCKPFKRGAIAAVCSIALSPFR